MIIPVFLMHYLSLIFAFYLVSLTYIINNEIVCFNKKIINLLHTIPKILFIQSYNLCALYVLIQQRFDGSLNLLILFDNA